MANPTLRNIDKYCRLYAEAEIALLENFQLPPVDYALVIPAFRESSDFLHRLQPLLQQQTVLLVLVINQPSSPGSPDAENLALWHQALSLTEQVQQAENLCMGKITHCPSHLLLVDRFHQGIDEKKGVGLARKLGCDLALDIHRRGLLKTPILFNSDADTLLPNNYFSAAREARQSNSFSALLYPFQHLCDDSKLGRATKIYEAKLQQYVDGLQRAGSAYAFHTIGSTIAISAEHYAQVRGFPPRSAGEDFYLLNKLAKVGNISHCSDALVNIFARQSNRVPFGTGPAVDRLMSTDDPEQAEIFYDPEVFTLLAQVLRAFEVCPKNIDECEIPALAREALRQLGVEACFAHLAKQCKTGQQYRKQLADWFDGFKTLKFIHALRDSGYPNISYAALQR